jgi:hypothetical protein
MRASWSAIAFLLAVACSGSVKVLGGNGNGGRAGAAEAGGARPDAVSGAGSGGAADAAGGAADAAGGAADATGGAANATGGASDAPTAGGGAAGSAGWATGGASSTLGHPCVSDTDCTRGTICAATSGTCELPCTPEPPPPEYAQNFAPCASGETCRVIFGSTVPKRCYRGCSRTDPTSCGIGYGCGDAGEATGVCLRVGTTAAGEVCPDPSRSNSGFDPLTSTGCKDSGFRCAGDPQRCGKPCDAAATEPGCPTGEECAIDTCVPTSTH